MEAEARKHGEEVAEPAEIPQEERGESGESLGESAAAETPHPENPTENAEAAARAECEVIVPPEEGERYTRAQKQVEAARCLVESADAEIETCLENIRRDLEAFENYEEQTLKPIVSESRQMLSRLGVEELPALPEATPVDLEAPENERLEIRDLSSGKGMAFVWGLVAVLASLAGWWIYGAQRAGVPTIPTRTPDLGLLEKVAGAISRLIGPADWNSEEAHAIIDRLLPEK